MQSEMKPICIALLLFSAVPCLAGYWGIAAEFANWSPAQSEYEAPILAQRGVNSVFLSMHGMDRNWPNWIRVQDAWRTNKVECIWDLPACVAECERIYGFLPGVLEIDDRAVLEDGSRAYFAVNPRLGNFFSSAVAEHVLKIAQNMTMQLDRPAGCRITANADLGNGSYDKEALASWQTFLRRFFADDSPARDTNGDKATFNSAFGTNYTNWKEVRLFTSAELANSSKRRLADLWLSDAYACFVDSVSGCVRPLTHGGPVGPGVGKSDFSLIACKKQIKNLFAASVEDVLLADCIAAVFGKRVFACPVTLVPGDLAVSRQMALKLLPYAEGVCFDYKGLVAKRTVPLIEDGGSSAPPDAEIGFDEEGNCVAPLPPNNPPSKIESFDSAFRIIPELAPFAGGLRVERFPVLWILSSDRHKKDLSFIRDAYCVSEATLALYPDSVDLSRYKAVIYLSTSPSISTAIFQQLFDYALNGGIVFIDAYNVASGKTLHGRDQSKLWWEHLKPQRREFGAGETVLTYAGSKRTFPFTAPYFTGGQGIIEVGRVTDSSGGSYPFLLVQKIGSAGKWVFINIPGLWETSFSLLREVVQGESGITLPDPSRVRVYSGRNCALAIGGAEPEGISIPCSHDEAVIFDVVSWKVFTSRTSNGLLRLPEKIAPGEAKLWVVKPYGKPVVLYTDGTLNYAASVSDGDYKNNVLRFTFAEQAFVSAPVRPKLLTIGGKPAEFQYDAEHHLITIKRVGDPVEAKIEF